MNESQPFPKHKQEFYFSRIDWLSYLIAIRPIVDAEPSTQSVEVIEIDEPAQLMHTALQMLHDLANKQSDKTIYLQETINKNISVAMLLDTCESIMFEIAPEKEGYSVSLFYKSVDGAPLDPPQIH